MGMIDDDTPDTWEAWSSWAERVVLPLLLAFALGVLTMDVARDWREADLIGVRAADCAARTG